MSWHDWWVWAAAGLGLGILEVLVPGYIFLGFSVAALVIALILGMGIAVLSPMMMLVIFALIALVAFLALRRVFPHSSGSVKIWKRDIND